MLCHLARNAQKLVTKDELLDVVWGHRHVSESVLKTTINQLRSLLDDDPRAPRFIETANRRGYRAIVSARSGESEDVSICHLAVGMNAGQLKVGSFTRSERMAKWNECLRIGEALGPQAFVRGTPLKATLSA